jgi:hypothetical protein
MDFFVKRDLIPEEESATVRNGASNLEAILDLVRPLVRNGRNPLQLDFEEDLLFPAAGRGIERKRELNQLCSAFSVILERTGTAVLTALSDYIATDDEECTLAHFVVAMEHVAGGLREVYERTSLIEMFHFHITKEYDRGTF